MAIAQYTSPKGLIRGYLLDLLANEIGSYDLADGRSVPALDYLKPELDCVDVSGLEVIIDDLTPTASNDIGTNSLCSKVCVYLQDYNPDNLQIDTAIAKIVSDWGWKVSVSPISRSDPNNIRIVAAQLVLDIYSAILP